MSDWTRLSPATSPAGRDNAGFAVDTARGKAVMFGGLTTLFFTSALDETWEWDGTTWAQITTAHSPSPRFAQWCMAFDPITNTILLFGGRDTSGNSINDTWSYDGTDWTQLTPTHAPAFNPLGAAYPALGTDEANSNVVMFAPVFAAVSTWVWSGTDWIIQSPALTPPLSQRPLAFDANTNLLTLGPGNHDTTVYHDLWTWDGTDWAQHVPVTRPNVGGGSGIAYSAEAVELVMYGGLDNAQTGYVNDTYLWDGTDFTLDTPLGSPPANLGMMMAIDPLTAKPMLFGGNASGVYPCLDQTWLYTGGAVPPPAADNPYLSANFSTV